MVSLRKEALFWRLHNIPPLRSNPHLEIIGFPNWKLDSNSNWINPRLVDRIFSLIRFDSVQLKTFITVVRVNLLTENSLLGSAKSL